MNEFFNKLKNYFKYEFFYLTVQEYNYNLLEIKLININNFIIINNINNIKIKYSIENIPYVIMFLDIILRSNWIYSNNFKINNISIENIDDLTDDEFIIFIYNICIKSNNDSIIITLNKEEIEYIFSLIFFIITPYKSDDYYFIETIKKLK